MTQDLQTDEEVEKLIAQKEALERKIQEALARKKSDKPVSPQPADPTTAPLETVVVTVGPPITAIDFLDTKDIANINAKVNLAGKFSYWAQYHPMELIQRIQKNTVSQVIPDIIPDGLRQLFPNQTIADPDHQEIKHYKNALEQRCSKVFFSKDLKKERRAIDDERKSIEEQQKRVCDKIPPELNPKSLIFYPRDLYIEYEQWVLRSHENFACAFLHSAAKGLPDQERSKLQTPPERGTYKHPNPINTCSFPNAWEAVSLALTATRSPMQGTWSVFLPMKHLKELHADWTFATSFGFNHLGNVPQQIRLTATFEDLDDGTCDIILDFETASGFLDMLKSGELETLINRTTDAIKNLAGRQLLT